MNTFIDTDEQVTIADRVAEDENDTVNAMAEIRAVLNNIEIENVEGVVLAIVAREGTTLIPGYEQGALLGFLGSKSTVEMLGDALNAKFRTVYGKESLLMGDESHFDGEAESAAEAFESAPEANDAFQHTMDTLNLMGEVVELQKRVREHPETAREELAHLLELVERTKALTGSLPADIEALLPMLRTLVAGSK